MSWRCSLPALLGLADREVGARRNPFRGRGWAIAALTGMVLLWCWRWAEHAHAYNLVAAADITPTPVNRIAIEPYPTNPWRWHALVETDTTWQVAEVDTRTGAVVSDSHVDALFKPTRTASVNVARNTYLGQVYLDWSSGLSSARSASSPRPAACARISSLSRPWVAVEFSDLRFAYSYLDTNMVAGPIVSLEPHARPFAACWMGLRRGWQGRCRSVHEWARTEVTPDNCLSGTLWAHSRFSTPSTAFS